MPALIAEPRLPVPSDQAEAPFREAGRLPKDAGEDVPHAAAPPERPGSPPPQVPVRTEFLKRSGGSPAAASLAERPDPSQSPAGAIPVATAVEQTVRPAILTLQPASAPVPAAPAPASPAPMPKSAQFAQQVGIAIARRVTEGRDELVVRMEPAELGKIQVRIAFDQGNLRVTLTADTAVVVEVLQRSSGELTRTLQDAGVATDQQSFRFTRGGSDPDGRSAPFHQPSDQQQQQQQQRHDGRSRWRSSSFAPGLDAEAPLSGSHPVRHRGHLNLFA